MTGRQKILKVLKRIKQKSEISPDPKWVEFDFNTRLVGSGILTNREEGMILRKIEKEGIIKLALMDSDDGETYLERSIDEWARKGFIWVEILPQFHEKYFWYSLISFMDNKWNYINPFWIFWQLLKSVAFLVKWAWGKNKPMAIIFGTLGALLVYDWGQAWKNLKIILNYLGTL